MVVWWFLNWASQYEEGAKLRDFDSIRFDLNSLITFVINPIWHGGGDTCILLCFWDWIPYFLPELSLKLSILVKASYFNCHNQLKPKVNYTFFNHSYNWFDLGKKWLGDFQVCWGTKRLLCKKILNYIHLIL